MTKPHDLFISYSHTDGDLARSLHSRLSDAGLCCFLAERDIRAAERWEDSIREALLTSERLLIVITPNSIQSDWVMVEAGAAWVLGKSIIPAVAHVKPEQLIAPIAAHQVRRVETPEQIESLVQELTQDGSITDVDISGQWRDPEDEDVVFCRQSGSRVVGFYDLGTKQKSGVYSGTLTDGVFKYHWRRLTNNDEGHGEMILSPDGRRLSGQYWYGKRKKEGLSHVGYERISDEMPAWLTNDDFDRFLDAS